jgi:hypothetical protein
MMAHATLQLRSRLTEAVELPDIDLLGGASDRKQSVNDRVSSALIAEACIALSNKSSRGSCLAENAGSRHAHDYLMEYLWILNVEWRTPSTMAQG